MAKKNVNETPEEVTEETVKIDTPIEEVKQEPEETKAAEPKAETKKSIEELADEVDRGVYGSGRERMILLGERYSEVQAEVVRRYKESIKL